MKQMTALKASVLLAAFAASGCTTTEYVHVSPQCTPPPQPTLPLIDQGELWDSLGDERYRELERYINGVWSFADEQGAMLDELCKP